MPGRVHMRLLLLDDSNCYNVTACTEPPGQALENYYTFNYVLDDATSEWQEIRVELEGSGEQESAFWRTGWTGQVGNNILDVTSLKGWRIEFSMDSQGGMNSTSSGVILLDQLQCVGSGDLFGAALWADRSQYSVVDEEAASNFEAAVKAGAWFDRYYESPLSRHLSVVSLTDGFLSLNYSIEQSETWGGFLDIQHIAPLNSYYNLTQASDVAFSYHVEEAASPSERAHLRLILMDGSDCETNCTAIPGQNLENYYSFHYVLDETNLDTDDISVEIIGNDNSASPFWRTGWTGQVGNNQLDPSLIKGYRFELNLNSQGDVGSVVSGKVSLSELKAKHVGGTNLIPGEDFGHSVCASEPGLLFQVDPAVFKRVEFLGSKCCETCDSDTDCLYAFNDGKDCYTASAITSDTVQLVNSEFLRSTVASFVSTNSSKRGDFCDRCECRPKDGTIDCRGKNLKILPVTFSSSSWKPRILDLRNNPMIFYVDANAFNALKDSLEVIFLPENIRHVPEVVSALPSLSAIHIEKEPTDSPGEGLGRNFIVRPDGFFEDVCCEKGHQLELPGIQTNLSFCSMRVHQPGIDSTYDPFQLYIEATSLQKLRPSSPFMGEAAESREKCAEFCSISGECRYFLYDARRKESEHTCILLKDNGTRTERECCQPDDFADDAGTIPGWTSGIPPRTRHILQDARLLISSSDLILSAGSNYSGHYELALGSSPLRGAVWVTPQLTTTTSLNVSIAPARVALYDAATTVKVFVAVHNPESLATGKSVIISHKIESCDVAFTSFAPSDIITVEIDILAEEDMRYLSKTMKRTGMALLSLQCVSCLLFMYWTVRNRSHSIVKKSQPIFLIIILIGCFTMALSTATTYIEGGYRYLQDPLSGNLTGNVDPDITRVDSSCMTFPWLFNLGFITTFSALFAKIWRVRLILKSAVSMRRVVVRAKDVAVVIVAFASVQLALLLSWQLVAPLKWEREVLTVSDSGFALESVGRCWNDDALSFIIPIAVYDFMCLLLALFLCYETRNVPSDLNESKWITVSIFTIFQVLVLTVPMLIIAWDDPNAFFFVRAASVAAISLSVSSFIFLPKVYNILYHDEWSSRRSSIFISPISQPLPSNNAIRGSSAMTNNLSSTGKRSSQDATANNESSGRINFDYDVAEKHPSDVVSLEGSRKLDDQPRVEETHQETKNSPFPEKVPMATSSENDKLPEAAV